jgi:CheY-like chemotaxis protein
LLGIVRSHGGFVTVDSQIGKGTTFSVFLPATAEGEVCEISNDIVLPPERNGELILVVDDEAPICEATQRTLEAHGYRAMTAGDGTEAITLIARHGDQVKVVLTDLVMPYMDGPALVRALKRMTPEVAIIASTGQEHSKNLNELKSIGVTEILIKPYTAEILLSALHRSLNSELSGARTGP